MTTTGEPIEEAMDDTRYLLPSEIARLVYGYLKQKGCDEVAEKFLNTSPHMKECLEVHNNHRSFMTKAHGLTLEEISNQCLKMNEMLLKAANNKSNNPKKLRDAIDAFKFIIGSSSSKDSFLVNEEPMTVDDDASSGICVNVNSSSDLGDKYENTTLPDDNVWFESRSKETEMVDERWSRLAADNNAKPARNIDLNAVLNKSGKVKVLRPRNSVPVAGKSMTRHEEPADQELTSNPLVEGESVSKELEPPSPGSPLRGDNNFDCEPAAFDENSLFETPSKLVAFENNVVTMQLRSQSAKVSEDFSSTSTRSHRNRKRSSGSWNGEQSSINKSLSNKTVPEIEVDPMLIQQTLINNSKLHECIAQNINKAISESPQKKTITDPADELNSTVKKVTDETMNDPLCKEIINELLGCLTNVSLGLDNETDIDGSNLSFPDKFYENTTTNDSNLQSSEPVGTNVTNDENNSNYQTVPNHVSASSQQQETEIIFTGEIQENDHNHSTEQSYSVENLENTNSNINSNVDIRSYFTNTPDIKESCDSAETIDGTIINILEPTNCSNFIPVHGIETTNQYCITSGVPLFIGNATATAATSVVITTKKRNSRTRPRIYPTTRVTRRLTPIAPKPIVGENIEVSPTPVALKNNQSRSRLTKKMKK